jgi:hypothetical protein
LQAFKPPASLGVIHAFDQSDEIELRALTSSGSPADRSDPNAHSLAIWSMS